MKYKVGFIGSGNMAFALIKAIKKAKLASSIISSDTKKSRLNLIKKKTGIKTTSNNKEVVKKASIIFIAVKPQIIGSILDEIKDTNKLIISIAAGITFNPR